MSTTVLLLATHNRGKLDELRDLFTGLPFTFVGLGDVGITEIVPETGTTFRDNAVLKATSYAERSQLPTVADDSGLEIAALAGEPGVRSARYLGDDATFDERIASLLQRLAGTQGAQRACRFVCAMALATPGGAAASVAVREGTVDGILAHKPRGFHGFGYDPIFELADGRVMAELGLEAKGLLSHRGAAARAMRLVVAERFQ